MINRVGYVMNVNLKWNMKMTMIKNVNFLDMIYTAWSVIKNLIQNSKAMYNQMSMLIKTVLKSEYIIIFFFHNFYNSNKRMD